MQSQKTTGYLILKVQFIVYYIFFLKEAASAFSQGIYLWKRNYVTFKIGLFFIKMRALFKT